MNENGFMSVGNSDFFEKMGNFQAPELPRSVNHININN